MRWALALIGCLSIGCGNDETTHEYENSGNVCVFSESDGAAVFRVEFGSCHSSSCSRVHEASCEVNVVDDRLVLESRGRVSQWGGTCTDDCRKFGATCVSAPLAPGAYRLVHGQQVAEVTLPAGKDYVIPANEGCHWL